MMPQKGFTLIEFLITLSLVVAMMATLIAVWLNQQQYTAQLNQVRMAEQLLNNIQEEYLIEPKAWSKVLIEDWQQQISQRIPQAQLHLSEHAVEIVWASHNALNIHCTTVHANETCVALRAA